jgi:transcriptional regulator with XRE-family HTH domain
MPSTPFGEQLKRERELRGVSLEEVATATRIAPRFLEALENEQWDKLPGGVFNRGFIRAVARYLGLDEDNLVSEYALSTKGRTDPGVVPDAPLKTESMWGRIATLVGVLLALIAVVAIAFHYLEPRIAARFHKTSGDAAGATYASAVSPAVTPINDPVPVATGVSLTLKVTVLKPVQITVLADGQPAFNGRVDKNETKIFSAQSAIDFASSDSAAVVLELNGQPVSSFGAPGQPLHRTFTQGDLKADAAVQH